MNRVVLLVLIFLLVSPFINAAENQKIEVEIDKYFKADFNQSLPLETRRYGGISFESVDFNKNYEFIQAFDDHGKIKPDEGEDGITFWLNKIENPTESITFQYLVSPAHNTEMFLSYEFYFNTDEYYLKDPHISISYPESLTLLNNFPRRYATDPIKINYPSDKIVGPAKVFFLKDNKASKFVQRKTGRFVVYGRDETVNRTLELLKEMDYLDSFYDNLIGDHPRYEINIILMDVEDTTFDLAGVAEWPNIILFEEDIAGNESTSQRELEKSIVHEVGHLALQNMFNGEITHAQWVNEGLPVFFEIYLMKHKYNISDYWIENDDGDRAYFYHLYDLFTEAGLRQRYNGDFYYKRSEEQGVDEEVKDFYSHAGLVFYNFYLETGEEGIRELYTRLQNYHPDLECENCDSEGVLKIMSEISGLSNEEILYPHRNSENFSKDVKPFTRQKYGKEDIESIFDSYWESIDNSSTETILDNTEEEIGEESFTLFDIVVILVMLFIPIGLIGGIILLIKGLKKEDS